MASRHDRKRPLDSPEDGKHSQQHIGAKRRYQQVPKYVPLIRCHATGGVISYHPVASATSSAETGSVPDAAHLHATKLISAPITSATHAATDAATVFGQYYHSHNNSPSDDGNALSDMGQALAYPPAHSFSFNIAHPMPVVITGAPHHHHHNHLYQQHQHQYTATMQVLPATLILVQQQQASAAISHASTYHALHQPTTTHTIPEHTVLSPHHHHHNYSYAQQTLHTTRHHVPCGGASQQQQHYYSQQEGYHHHHNQQQQIQHHYYQQQQQQTPAQHDIPQPAQHNNHSHFVHQTGTTTTNSNNNNISYYYRHSSSSAEQQHLVSTGVPSFAPQILLSRLIAATNVTQHLHTSNHTSSVAMAHQQDRHYAGSRPALPNTSATASVQPVNSVRRFPPLPDSANLREFVAHLVMVGRVACVEYLLALAYLNRVSSALERAAKEGKVCITSVCVGFSGPLCLFLCACAYSLFSLSHALYA